MKSLFYQSEISMLKNFSFAGCNKISLHCQMSEKMTQIFSTVAMNGVGNAFNMVEIGKKVMRSPAPTPKVCHYSLTAGSYI